MFFLSETVKVTSEAPTATGTTTIDSAAYDTAGFDGILFVVRLGAPAANNNIRVQQDSASNMAAAADLTGTLVGHATNNQLMVDLKRPLERYVRCRVTRGTTSTIDALTVIQYRARNLPVTQPTASTLEQWASPVEGTA